MGVVLGFPDVKVKFDIRINKDSCERMVNLRPSSKLTHEEYIATKNIFNRL